MTEDHGIMANKLIKIFPFLFAALLFSVHHFQFPFIILSHINLIIFGSSKFFKTYLFLVELGDQCRPTLDHRSSRLNKYCELKKFSFFYSAEKGRFLKIWSFSIIFFNLCSQKAAKRTYERLNAGDPIRLPFSLIDYLAIWHLNT